MNIAEEILGGVSGQRKVYVLGGEGLFMDV